MQKDLHSWGQSCSPSVGNLAKNRLFRNEQRKITLKLLFIRKPVPMTKTLALAVGSIS